MSGSRFGVGCRPNISAGSDIFAFGAVQENRSVFDDRHGHLTTNSWQETESRRAGVTAVYDRHSYDAEKKEALDQWAKRLTRMVSGLKEATHG